MPPSKIRGVQHRGLWKTKWGHRQLEIVTSSNKTSFSVSLTVLCLALLIRNRWLRAFLGIWLIWVGCGKRESEWAVSKQWISSVTHVIHPPISEGLGRKCVKKRQKKAEKVSKSVKKCQSDSEKGTKNAEKMSKLKWHQRLRNSAYATDEECKVCVTVL